MMQEALTERERNQGRKQLKTLYRNSPIFNRMDIDDMSVEEAKRIWRTLGPHLPTVASWASGKKKDVKHLDVLTAMQLIQKKAEGGNVDER